MSKSVVSHHKLRGKWDLYYHLPNDPNWNLASYKSIMKDIDSVEKVIRLNEAINENIVKQNMFFFNAFGYYSFVGRPEKSRWRMLFFQSNQ